MLDSDRWLCFILGSVFEEDGHPQPQTNNCWHFNIYELEKFHAQLS